MKTTVITTTTVTAIIFITATITSATIAAITITANNAPPNAKAGHITKERPASRLQEAVVTAQ